MQTHGLSSHVCQVNDRNITQRPRSLPVGVFRDGSAYGSAFRSNLLSAAPASSLGHCLDLGRDVFLQAAAFRKHS